MGIPRLQHRDDWIAYEGGGLATEAGFMDRRVQSGEFFVPAHVTVTEGMVRWQWVKDGLEPKLITIDSKGPLTPFMRLCDGDDESVAAFVKGWGPLCLASTVERWHLRCHKGSNRDVIPTPKLVAAFFGPEESVSMETTSPYVGYGDLWSGGEEPTELYRTASRRLRSDLRLAAEYHSGRDTEYWESRFPYHCDNCDYGIVRARNEIGVHLTRYLSMGEVRLGISPITLRVEVAISGLFGALALQMLLAAARSAGLYICDGCGYPYVREAKAPKANNRNFCGICSDANRPKYSAKATYRANQRRALSLWREGVPAEEIARQLERDEDRIQMWIKKGVVQ